MATNAIFNRIQIFFYSILISIMSGVNRLRSYPEPEVSKYPLTRVTEIEPIAMAPDENPGMSIHDYLKYAQQAISAIFIWIILGFATGFLAGLINFR